MFKKLIVYAGSYKKYTYAAAFLMTVGVIASVVPYLFLYQIIKEVIDFKEISISVISFRVLGIMICAILHTILYNQGLLWSHLAAYHTLKNIRISLQGKLERQPLGNILSYGNGTIKKMFVDDIEAIEVILAHAIPEGFANVLVPIIVYVAMFLVDYKLALLSLASLPIGILAMGIMIKGGMQKLNDYYQSAQVMNNTIVEYINGMEVVKVFNKDKDSFKKFATNVKNYRDLTLAWYKECWPYMALYNSILPCLAMVTLPLGTYFVLCGYSTMPDLILILCMGFSVGTPLLKSVSFCSLFPNLQFKIDSLEKMLESCPLKQSQKGFVGKNHEVSFRDVCFSYHDKEVLHQINLNIKEGCMTALVGASGSGKSTLAKLLVHFYDCSSGSIQIGGQDITDMSIEALNQEIAYVSQEQFLFNCSLMENIRLGKLSATDAEVYEAAEKAQCNEFLSRLSNGIHTMAGDGGKQLSGGERQRISLARALLKDAPIIVLDEATAFMDPENEEKMNQAITEVVRNKTVIVIAHRLPSIMNADQIVVLKEGNVLATGTHAQLLETCNDYETLWNAARSSATWGILKHANNQEEEVL